MPVSVVVCSGPGEALVRGLWLYQHGSAAGFNVEGRCRSFAVEIELILPISKSMYYIGYQVFIVVPVCQDVETM